MSGVLLEKAVFDGDIEYLQVMDEAGNMDQSLLPRELDDNKIVEMYKYMLFARANDAKMLSLQRQGRAVTYAPLVGEEATQIGSALAMRKDDIFVPTFRQHGVYLVRGMPLEWMYAYWRGYEEPIPKSVNGTAIIIPVATQMPHAAGLAYAQKYKKKDSVVVVYVGDGGTSEGDFYEALNFAGVWKLPLVVIIENNQWAISVPREKQTAAKTLAQKAFAAGIGGIQVDGNDVIAVYKATKEAIEKAKDGPMVIECVTYRLGLHTTADDPTKYRTDAEVESWKGKDPIARVRAYLTGKGLWNEEMEQKTVQEQGKEIDAAVEKTEHPKEDPKSIFTNVYSFVPQNLQEELDDAERNNFWQDGSQ
ncbi:MAG: pyruvate dehydrogenase (acetyl-transferring) E1 component subunit alpha [Candidatus Marsarchaeota archaeon]|jgi:pyruvate dehydrogenase E1 component alpha subunit|nr:pyruvate dehydrogenase (acetyl-transferring) E1 component subunit alpha [Candidatus Marsarchaeota archaeon]